MFLDIRNARRLISTNPVTILTTEDKEGNVNAMTAAWNTPVSLDPTLIMISVHEERFSMRNLEETGEEKGFVLNVPSRKHLQETYYLGTRSGEKEENKIENAGLSLKESEEVEVSKVKECVAWIECEVKDMVKEGDHYLIIGKPVSAEVEDDLWQGTFLANKAEVLHHMGGNQFLCNGEVEDVELDLED